MDESPKKLVLSIADSCIHNSLLDVPFMIFLHAYPSEFEQRVPDDVGDAKVEDERSTQKRDEAEKNEELIDRREIAAERKIRLELSC
ncbi:hypothetical protein L6452_20584 [Arctium lappa]|uniref:Uncharacterized protein n=1 Tax=Arctium lappa TaxID=4217 RepID=A0ACB9BCA5_ARCLA|nr:hypothetical protein L6452_20584 [Arctium lappa]